jgi:hypothetical protein
LLGQPLGSDIQARSYYYTASFSRQFGGEIVHRKLDSEAAVFKRSQQLTCTQALEDRGFLKGKSAVFAAFRVCRPQFRGFRPRFSTNKRLVPGQYAIGCGAFRFLHAPARILASALI